MSCLLQRKFEARRKAEKVRQWPGQNVTEKKAHKCFFGFFFVKQAGTLLKYFFIIVSRSWRRGRWSTSHTWWFLQSWVLCWRRREVSRPLFVFSIGLDKCKYSKNSFGSLSYLILLMCGCWFDLFTPVRRELHSDCLALLQAPHIQEAAQLTLPLDINNYPFYRYVQIYFKVRESSVSLKLLIQSNVLCT